MSGVLPREIYKLKNVLGPFWRISEHNNKINGRRIPKFDHRCIITRLTSFLIHKLFQSLCLHLIYHITLQDQCRKIMTVSFLLLIQIYIWNVESWEGGAFKEVLYSRPSIYRSRSTSWLTNGLHMDSGGFTG